MARRPSCDEATEISMSIEATVPSVLATGKRRRDYRMPTVLSLVAAVAALGYGVSVLPGRGVQGSAPPSGAAVPAAHAPMGFAGLSESAAARQDVAASALVELPVDPTDQDAPQAQKILKEAGKQIKGMQYGEAITTMHNMHALMQKYPESYLLLGRALEGKKDYATARDFYKAAIDRDPYLAEAYWGFGTASEALGDMPSALGAMRSFLHTKPATDKNRLKIAQARSAIWEWESKLGRGPWGPTKGVPPGLKPEDIKRDGKGAGTMMPLPNTERTDGSMQYEIKAGKKLEKF